jgi:hypothetical protein
VIAAIPGQSDLASIVSILGQLKEGLAQLVAEENIGGELQVERWETGSLLVFLWLKTMAAVELFGKALKGAAIVYQEIQKGRILGQHVDLLKEHVREKKIKNEVAEVLGEAQKQLINQIVEREARVVEDAFFDAHDNERLLRIQNSIRLLADLFDKGTTVYPALEMPKEKRDVFPDLKELGTFLSPLKELKEGDGKKDDAAESASDEGQSAPA